MKKYLGILLCILLLPFTVNAKEKVKVYMFEAGGCPYCEQEETYLKGLDSYNEKFTLEKKELFEDHNFWKPGKDFYLGVKVANAFKAYDGTKFKDATYQGTPLIVISDLYAAAAYNPDLEKVIEEAYQKGDKDIVGCIADDKNDCLKGYDAKAATEEADEAYESAMAYYNYLVEQQNGGSTNTNTNNYGNRGKVELSQNGILILVITIIVIFVAMLIVVNVQLGRKIKKTEEPEKAKEEPKAETKATPKATTKTTTTKKTSKPAAKKATTKTATAKAKTTAKKKTTVKTTK